MRCSCTASPSENHRGTSLSETPMWKVCAISCQSVEAQLKSPRSRAAGESMASAGPKLTPSAPIPTSPTVRTEKSA